MSALGRDLRHGLGIARVELRRSVRSSFGTRKRQLTVLGFLALFSPLAVFWGRVAYTAGREAAERGSLPLDVLGVQVTLLVLVFVVMAALRVVQQGRPDGDALLLTATSPRAVLVGVTAHATVQFVGFVSLPTLLFAGAFALGAGALSVVATTLLAAVPLFTAVTVLGTVVGQLVVLGLLESRALRAASRLFGLVLLLVLMALSYAAMAPLMGVSAPLASLTGLTAPAVLYLAFVFAGTAFGPALEPAAFLVAGVVVASVPALFAVATRLAPRLWFADATPTTLLQRDATPAAGATQTAGRATERRGGSFPPGVGPRPLALALGLWVRWLRVPVRFSTLLPLVVVLVTGLFAAAGDPASLPLVVGGVLVFGGAYLSGGVFGLNPLGEAGAMRTVEYLSPTAPRTLVHGHVLAGLLVGTPVAVLGVAILGLVTALSAPATLAVGLLAVALTVASGGVAVGVGSVLPSGDAQRTYRGYEVATPSQWALVAYVVVTLLLVSVTAVGALLVSLATDAATTAPLLVAAAVGVALLLLGVGYAGVRVAVGRVGAPPSHDASDDLRDTGSSEADGDGPATTGTLRAPDFSRTQVVRGLVLLGAFVVLRAVVARAWDRYFPGGYGTDPLFLAFLAGTFLLLSVGLVYLGFTRWVGVDLEAWWVDRRRLRGDLLWGLVGVVLVLVVTLGGTLALVALVPGLAPAGAADAATAPAVTASGLGVNLLLGWFFGFAIAAFQEETLFRGFLQGLLRERYGRVTAIVGQSAVFTLAHLGYYPVSAWPLLLVVFLVGLVTGWLVDRRGTLLPAGLAHGFVG
jgi:membrane protease YdiL (CAAX protease family)